MQHTSIVFTFAASLVFLPSIARAQVPPSPLRSSGWSVEFEAGIVATPGVGAGNSNGLPAPGSPFTTIVGGRPSRQVPSWFFGDGSALLDEVLTSMSVPSRMVPLDPLLTSKGLEGRTMFVAGFRAVRAMTPRYSIEAGVDFGPAPVGLGQSAIDQVQASLDGFANAFSAILGDPTRFTGAGITTTADVRSGGYRASLTGAIRIHLPEVGRIKPYVVAGGGGVFGLGDGPVAALTGNYTFMAPGFGTRVFNETDQLFVRYRLAPARPVAIAGAGFTRAITRKQGIVVDGRFSFVPNAFETVLEARPNIAPDPSPAIISTLTVPSIQFDTRGNLSSLHNNLSGFTSHDGSMTTSLALVVRWYVRY